MSQVRLWRKQGAEALSSLVSKMQGSISNIDAMVDDLIRALSNLTVRPAGRQPYEGLFSPSNTNTWRQQAAQRLLILVTNIQGDTYNFNDGLADDLIRTINNLPPRPASRNPYEGILPQPTPSPAPAPQPTPAPAPQPTPAPPSKVDPAMVQAWRETAANTVDTLVTNLKGAESNVDGMADDLIRTLSKISARPAGRSAYVGIFAPADPTQWRQQAGDRLRELISAIKATTFVTEDGLVDDLIRAINKLPPRPTNRNPYEGVLPKPSIAATPTPSASPKMAPDMVQAWRKQAAIRTDDIVSNLKGTESNVDGMVDDLIRTLSKIPARPTGRSAYSGLFSPADISKWRQQAGDRLRELISAIQATTFVAEDGLVDDLVRAINKLPPRPAGKDPYTSIFPEPSRDFVTLAQLLAIAPNASSARVQALLPYINQTLEEFQINTPLRMAHFLAQVGHESGEFYYVEEIASGADYEGRTDLGNVYPGDGVRFKGRGLIQVTGRSNYQSCGKALGVDLISNPRRLQDFDLAARSAGWFWNRERLNPDADNDDVLTITRVINGGYNGLDHRKQLLANAKRVFGI